MRGWNRTRMWWILPSAAGIRNVSSTVATTRRPNNDTLVTVNIACIFTTALHELERMALIAADLALPLGGLDQPPREESDRRAQTGQHDRAGAAHALGE